MSLFIETGINVVSNELPGVHLFMLMFVTTICDADISDYRCLAALHFPAFCMNLVLLNTVTADNIQFTYHKS